MVGWDDSATILGMLFPRQSVGPIEALKKFSTLYDFFGFCNPLVVSHPFSIAAQNQYGFPRTKGGTGIHMQHSSSIVLWVKNEWVAKQLLHVLIPGHGVKL